MKWSPMVLWSVILHLVVFSSLLFVPESFPTTRRPYGAVVYEVDLVEMPAATAAKSVKGPGATRKKTTEKPVKIETKTRRIETTKRAEKPLVIAKKTVDKPTTPVTKPEVSSAQLIEKAISKIEKKVQIEEPPESHVDEAISRLQTKVGDEMEEAPRAAPGPSGPSGPTENTRPIGGTAIQLYQMEVENWIKGHWSYPVAMDNTRDLRALVVLTVKNDGAILNTRFEKRSSSAVFDESVLKAIERSNPLPPFPESYGKHYEKDEIEINFNLKDLENT